MSDKWDVVVRFQTLTHLTHFIPWSLSIPSGGGGGIERDHGMKLVDISTSQLL